MRPIKFRGKRVDNGEYVYGDLIQAVTMSSFPGIVVEDVVYDVDPESVTQLIGYDSNGKEVYEGDTLVSTTGETLIEALWTTDFSNFTLKEAKS